MRFTATIVGNMLISTSWKGIFVRRGDERGLVFVEAPTDRVRNEYGHRTSTTQ